MANNIRALLYDLDGVIVKKTQKMHYEALNSALAKRGYSISEAEQKSTFHGLTTVQKLEILTEKKGLPAKFHRNIINDKNELYSKLFSSSNQSNSDVKKSLLYFKKRGFKQVLCSNTTKQTVVQVVEAFEIQDYFDAIFTRQDIQNPKPHPEIYNLAIEFCSYMPSECLIFEDSDSGIESAIASGAITYRVTESDTMNIKLINKAIEKA